MRKNSVNTSNSLDVAFGVISLIPGRGQVIGGVYFITNYLLEQHTGKNLGQHIDGYFNQ